MPQLTFQTPVRADKVVSFAAGSEDDKPLICFGKVIGSWKDRDKMLALSIILEQIADSNESPLKRALLSSGLAEDMEIYVSDGIAQPYLMMLFRGISDGRYKLDILLNEQMSKGEDEQDKKLVRSIYDVDEQISLVNAAVTGKLIESYKGNNPPSETRISAEILYNQLPLTVVGAFMILAGILIIVIAEIIRKKGFAVKLGILLIISAFQLAVFLLRWYISGNIPLSNGYETMAFVSLSTSLLTLLAIWMLRKQTFVCNTVTIGGLMIAGLTLLVAHLSEMSPQITSLMPVLHSPLVKKDARLDVLNRLMLYPAEIFLTIGIFLGAIWANQSWGTYWSWDPKEVWALISMLIYCVPLHVGSLPVMRKAKVHDIYLIIAFLSILMTYFGVNYLLGGMHSYAGN